MTEGPRQTPNFVRTASGLARRSGVFARLLLWRLDEDKAMINAAALTYTTLLALVPLMTVFVSVLAAFPVGERLVDQIQDFVFKNFVPAAGEVVRSYLEEFSGKAARLTGPSFLFLVLTSLLMMASIDRAFNDIWRVRQVRPPVTKFLVYWAVITVGPLLMGLSVAVTSYLLSLPLFTDAAENLGGRSRFLQAAPLLASTLAFTLLYLLVPLRRVPLRHAVAGGITAAVLFELAKRGFGAYLTYFPTYEAIYGALATVPIFLVWVYLSWLVTLFGAELTYCLGISGVERHRETTCGHRLAEAFALLRELWRAQVDGRTPSVEQLAGQAGILQETAEALLTRFTRHQWVAVTEHGGWVLLRDVNRLRLRDLYNIADLSLPRKAELAAPYLKGMPLLADRLDAVDKELADVMDVPVTELFGNDTAATG